MLFGSFQFHSLRSLYLDYGIYPGDAAIDRDEFGYQLGGVLSIFQHPASWMTCHDDTNNDITTTREPFQIDEDEAFE
ncbi:predicted protein [Lichtheimia corymbifera JMRC:FSU:9682]|uniref:Uncharacterized protein n=1 Tax=Lichtheimia corymbifera JMRC:FSU:9682 TaxID=1263082 RepID=A0A068RSQ3_9FUNG|nr:predicted protein [Lichtheimia corymbifera JMRC:FSU:9682]